jgi:hypothetical protein
MPEDNNKNQESSVNEAAPAYLSAKKNTALLEAEGEAPKPRFVLNPDKYTGGVPDMDKMTKEELDAEIEKGFASVRAGRYYTSEEVSERFWQKYGIRI